MCYCIKNKKFGWMLFYCCVFFCNQFVLFFQYECIEMILVKVKVLCLIVEKFVMQGCEDFVYLCCQVCCWVEDCIIFSCFFDEIVLCFLDCFGGYLCIIKFGFCCGDGVECVIFEFVDYEFVLKD